MTRKEKGVINQSVEKAVAEILAQGNPAELFGNGDLFQELKKQLVCKILEHEMNAHIGYEKHSKDEEELNNRRNGSYEKTLIDEDGASLLLMSQETGKENLNLF